MIDLKELGKVWMASSPLTERIEPILKAIDCGVDAIVLKSATTLDKPKKIVGKRIIKIDKIDDMYGRWIIPVGEIPEYRGTLFCTSTALDVEIMSFEESNKLYDQIKKQSKHTKVIASFSPITKEDFSRIEELKGDAVELNLRWYNIDCRRPYVARVSSFPGQTSNDLSRKLNELIEQNKTYQTENERKFNEIKQATDSLPPTRPVILKLARDLFEMDPKYWDLPYPGLTFSDSMKNGVISQVNGVQVDHYGKGSLCGAILREETIAMTTILKERYPERYVSASGGIMDANDALSCLENGADSIQLCSTAYVNGFKRVKEIVDSIKNIQ